jgi:hypothetical protein
MRRSREIAIIAVLVALAIGTNYALISIYNVKFMDLITFVGGFCFGPIVGAAVGIFSWIIYGAVNPLGFSLHIWVATMSAEAVFGVAGGILGRSMRHSANSASWKRKPSGWLFLGAIGMLLTLLYDVITNAVWGYIYGPNMVIAVIMGFVPFGLVHMISNAFFFGVGGIPTIRAVLKVVGGENGHAIVE